MPNTRETAYNQRLQNDESAAEWWYTGKITIRLSDHDRWLMSRRTVVMSPHEACRWGYSDQVLKWVNDWIEDMKRVEQVL